MGHGMGSVVSPVPKCEGAGAPGAQEKSRGVAQSGSASALGAEGRGFESLRARPFQAIGISSDMADSGHASAFSRYSAVGDFETVATFERFSENFLWGLPR
jgi:hypothetical protein